MVVKLIATIPDFDENDIISDVRKKRNKTVNLMMKTASDAIFGMMIRINKEKL